MIDARTRHALLHALTSYDRRQEAAARRPGRYHNPYALAHYCGALQRTDERVAAGLTLREALVMSFCGRLLDVVLRAAGEPLSTDSEQRA